jgi:hypothetical protein
VFGTSSDLRRQDHTQGFRGGVPGHSKHRHLIALQVLHEACRFGILQNWPAAGIQDVLGVLDLWPLGEVPIGRRRRDEGAPSAVRAGNGSPRCARPYAWHKTDAVVWDVQLECSEDQWGSFTPNLQLNH